MFPCIKICLINYLFHEKCKRKARDVQFRVIVFPNVWNEHAFGPCLFKKTYMNMNI